MPDWETTAPTASVTSGAGCGTADPSFLIVTVEDTSQADGAWHGTFTCNLHAVTVELHTAHTAHTAHAGTARAVPGFAVTPRLFFDGAQVALETADVEATPTPSATGASEKVVFTLDGLGIVERDEDDSPVAGESTVEHITTLQVNHTYLDGSPVGAWLWDTTEVPAGLVLDPATSAGPVVHAVGC